MTGQRTRFETEGCPRCGGSGWFSYCQTWGHTCFECGIKPHEPGMGYRLTRRGRVAYAFYEASLPTKRAADLVAGDVIREYGQWVKVRAVTDNSIDRRAGYGLPDGTFEYSGVNIYVGSDARPVTLCGIRSDTLYPVKPADEERQRLVQLALAYQATLTKRGTVRKKRPSRISRTAAPAGV